MTGVIQNVLSSLLGELNGWELPKVAGLVEELPVMGLNVWI